MFRTFSTLGTLQLCQLEGEGHCLIDAVLWDRMGSTSNSEHLQLAEPTP